MRTTGRRAGGNESGRQPGEEGRRRPVGTRDKNGARTVLAMRRGTMSATWRSRASRIERRHGRDGELLPMPSTISGDARRRLAKIRILMSRGALSAQPAAHAPLSAEAGADGCGPYCPGEIVARVLVQGAAPHTGEFTRFQLWAVMTVAAGLAVPAAALDQRFTDSDGVSSPTRPAIPSSWSIRRC